jgi:hypothetical protein
LSAGIFTGAAESLSQASVNLDIPTVSEGKATAKPPCVALTLG